MSTPSLEPSPFFRALADTTRLRCIALLQAEGELCVCELTYALAISQPKMSRHLAALRDVGVVADRRTGYWVHYRLHPALPPWAQYVIRDTVAGIADTEPFAGDAHRLAVMPERPQFTETHSVGTCALPG